MTNKFRDALELYPRKGSSVETLGRFQFDFASTIKQALTIAAELRDCAETIKALDAICDRYYADEVIGAEVMVSAMDASPVIKKLAKLVKEGE